MISSESTSHTEAKNICIICVCRDMTPALDMKAAFVSHSLNYRTRMTVMIKQPPLAACVNDSKE